MKLRSKVCLKYFGGDEFEKYQIEIAKQRIEQAIDRAFDSPCMIADLEIIQESRRVLGRGLRALKFISGFSYLHFRGDVVLSPYNAIEGTLDKQWILEENNPGVEPHSHLSSHFTPRTDDPSCIYSFSLQAEPYINDDIMKEAVKAIFANHYCVNCCQGFMANDKNDLPVIVVRPEGASPGRFGVYYGCRDKSTFACGVCGHICRQKKCKECFYLEKKWLSLWSKQNSAKNSIIQKENINSSVVKSTTITPWRELWRFGKDYVIQKMYL